MHFDNTLNILNALSAFLNQGYCKICGYFISRISDFSRMWIVEAITRSQTQDVRNFSFFKFFLYTFNKVMTVLWSCNFLLYKVRNNSVRWNVIMRQYVKYNLIIRIRFFFELGSESVVPVICKILSIHELQLRTRLHCLQKPDSYPTILW